MVKWMMGAVAAGCCGPVLLAAVAMASPEPADERIRVACVGDSITQGSGLRDPERESYPSVLQDLLGDEYEVRNYGVSGATALRKGALPYWDLLEFRAACEFAPHIVILMLGTNDANMSNRRDRERFEEDLRALGRHFAGLASRPVMVLGVPPACFGLWRAYQEAVLQREIRPSVKRVVEREGWRLVDVYGATTDRGDWFPDGVHPNAEGATAVARAVQEILQTLNLPEVSDRK